MGPAANEAPSRHWPCVRPSPASMPGHGVLNGSARCLATMPRASLASRRGYPGNGCRCGWAEAISGTRAGQGAHMERTSPIHHRRRAPLPPAAKPRRGVLAGSAGYPLAVARPRSGNLPATRQQPHLNLLAAPPCRPQPAAGASAGRLPAICRRPTPGRRKQAGASRKPAGLRFQRPPRRSATPRAGQAAPARGQAMPRYAAPRPAAAALEAPAARPI